MKLLNLVFILGLCISCNETNQTPKHQNRILKQATNSSMIILGTVQDAGSPHIACKKECCETLFSNHEAKRKVVSLGLIDADNKSTYLFDATPDITKQLKSLKLRAPFEASELPKGIFITHAHIGHYTGLMYLGKEATNATNVNVFAMPKMKSFLEKNGPWEQLVSNSNITLTEIHNNEEIVLSNKIKVIPFKVPHRDEYSETVGYKIIGPNKKVLFIPDIDKWSKWETNIIDAVKDVDFAFLDATFYDAAEINNRDISEIPHPFVIETMKLFNNQPEAIRNKIHFIHLNHTNPLLKLDSEQTKMVLAKGFKIARINDIVEL